MNAELVWLGYAAIFTALIFVPYVANRMLVRGIIPTMGNPRSDDLPLAPWADRAQRAHANAVENLVVFAPLIIILNISGNSNETTVLAAQLFLIGRIGHYIVYVLGIPVVRTLLFFVSYIGIIIAALQLISI